MKQTISLTMLIAVLAALLLWPRQGTSHCDTLDGPVIQEAKRALLKKDVTPVLKWIQPQDEDEMRKAFANSIKVRDLNDEAREMADRHFFETLVRVHRAGEGEPYTGLKPAGVIEPGIAAADAALHAESIDELATRVAKQVEMAVRDRFAKALEKKRHADDSVEAGRGYVASYIEYVHLVESIHQLAAQPPGEHQHLHAEEHIK